MQKHTFRHVARLAIPFGALAFIGALAQAQTIQDVNPVNVPPANMANAPQATPAPVLKPMAPSDPRAISHLPDVLPAVHNGINGVGPGLPSGTSAATLGTPAVVHPSLNPGPGITLEGTISGDPASGHVFLRSNGFVYTVQPYDRSLIMGLHGGDRVRVYGIVDGLILSRANVKLLSQQSSSSADDYGSAATR